MTLTGLVIAQDEARDLPGCLAALSFCDERLVIDGGSQDGTVALAEQAGARVVRNPWPGYAAQRKLGLAQASGDWVLAVDADERVDDILKQSVLKAVGSTGMAGYRVRVENWVAGRRLRFGGLGHDDHLRLLRRDRAQVAERAVHEGFSVDGPIGQLGGALVHESYADLAELIGKVDRYSTLGAVDGFERGRRASRLGAGLRLPWAFFRRYVLFLGFLDGYPGFLNASLQAYGEFLKLAKLRELMERRPPSEGAK